MSLTLARFAALQKTQTVAVRRLVDLTLRHAEQSSKIGAEYLDAVLGVQQESLKQLAASSTPVELAASQIAFAQSFARPVARHANKLYQVLSTTHSEALSIAVDAAVSALAQRGNAAGAAPRSASRPGDLAAAPPAAHAVGHSLAVATDEAAAATQEALNESAAETTDAPAGVADAQALGWAAAGASAQRDAVPEAASSVQGAAPADETKAAQPAQASGGGARDESMVAVPAASEQYRPPFAGQTAAEPASNEHASAEPASTEPASAEPASTEHASTEPAFTQPASANVAAARPARRVKAPEHAPSGGGEASRKAGAASKRSISASRVKR
jgi:hypothetical protein